MAIEFDITSIKLGATIAAAGETEYLATEREVDDAVERIQERLNKAATKAKKLIAIERNKSAYA